MDTTLKKWLKIGLMAILIPAVLGLIVNLVSWIMTKDKVEITLKLDGWITIGSINYSDLPNLKLMLDQKEIKNILKVSWRIMNTGNKGIQNFESGPFIEFPKGSNIIAAKVSETSPFLKVDQTLEIKDHQAFIHGLGIFNSGDFFKVDVYLRDIPEQDITVKYFYHWKLYGKSLNLSILKDITSFNKNNKSFISSNTLIKIEIGMLITLFIQYIYIKFFADYRRESDVLKRLEDLAAKSKNTVDSLISKTSLADGSKKK